MLSGFSRLLLALAALSPVTVIWAIVDADRNGFAYRQAGALLVAMSIAFICWALFHLSERHLTKTTFKASEVKAVDNEVVAYVVTYLFPLVVPSTGGDLGGMAAVGLVLAIVLGTSNAFTFNPLVTLLGYRFYEVKNAAGITYLIVSKSDITDTAVIKKVGTLSRHLLLHIE